MGPDTGTLPLFEITADGYACPVDPADRLQCDSCQ